MLSCLSVAPSLVPRMLGALLLLAASLTVQDTVKEHITCPRPEVYMLKGHQVRIACNIPNAVVEVKIWQDIENRDILLFNVSGPGRFHQNGWQLQVQGGKAELVIEAAQDDHVGVYVWQMKGQQEHHRLFLLKMSEVEQSPNYAVIPEGGSVNITCSTDTDGPLREIFLKRLWLQPADVIRYKDEKEVWVDEPFQDRITLSGTQDNLTITLRNLKEADSGVYSCQALLDDYVWGPGTMLTVTGAETAGFPAGNRCPLSCPCCQPRPPPTGLAALVHGEDFEEEPFLDVNDFEFPESSI